MRLRLSFRLFIIVALFLFIFYICYRISNQIIGNLVKQKNVGIPKSRKITNILEKSVYIRDNNTDLLVSFSAYRQGSSIYVVLPSFGYFQRKVYCRYFNGDLKELEKPNAIMIFPEFTAKCENKKEAEFIALTVDKRDKVKKEELKRIQESREGYQYDFSICLAPIYGSDPKWLTLLEFIEFYKLQGADHFYIYVLETNDLVEKILEHYKKENLAEVIRLPNNTRCLGRHRCRHEFQLQECLIRARGASKFVGTVDLDERIVPTRGTLKSYIRQRTKLSIGEFRFRCQWVLRYEDVPTKIPSTWKEVRNQMPTVRWHNTSHVAPLNHTTKSIIDPEKVESMGVHQVLRFRKGADAFLVPPGDALVRHYRLQKGWDFFLKETETFGNFINSSIETDLQEKLEQNVKTAICSIFNKFCTRLIRNKSFVDNPVNYSHSTMHLLYVFVMGILPFVSCRPEIDLKSSGKLRRQEEIINRLQNYLKRHVIESQNRDIEKESMPNALEQAAVFLAEKQLKPTTVAALTTTTTASRPVYYENSEDGGDEDGVYDGGDDNGDDQYVGDDGWRAERGLEDATTETANTFVATDNEDGDVDSIGIESQLQDDTAEGEDDGVDDGDDTSDVDGNVRVERRLHDIETATASTSTI